MMAEGVGTGDEGVQPFDLMHEAMLLQEVERTVDGGWLAAQAFVAQRFQDVIGPHRAVFTQQDLMNPLAYGCELQGVVSTILIRFLAGVLDAFSVVVMGVCHGYRQF